MKKNGFTLTECVVAIGIALAVGFLLASVSILSISNTNKAKALNLGLNELQNVAKIISTTELESENVYNPINLQRNLKTLYKIEFDLTQEKLQNGINTTIIFDKNCQINNDGKTRIQFSFKKYNEYFIFGGEIKLENKILYQNENIFSKRVVWGM